MIRRTFALVCALCALAAPPARAQGIPVIDAANLAQAIEQVINDITAINNQVQQITQLHTQIASLNGTRLLGTAAHNLLLSNYVPAEVYTVVNAVQSLGYDGLNTTARALRDAGMVYNCLDLDGAARTACQAALAQPYQHKGLLQDAMKSAAGRLAQINALMELIDGTTDQKGVQEIQARIGAENALLAHEVSQIQMLQGMADSEDRIARSRERERQYETLLRAGKLATHLP